MCNRLVCTVDHILLFFNPRHSKLGFFLKLMVLSQYTSVVPILFFSGRTLGFLLGTTAYPNGSTVLRTDIGEGDDALRCTTDSTTCCTNNHPEMRGGEFYMPDGSQVLLSGTTVNGYYRFRESQGILLHRRSPGIITGQFRCNIPQASGPPDADLYVNIGEYRAISSMPSRDNASH